MLGENAPNPLEYEEEDYEGPNQIKITAALELPKIPVLESADKQVRAHGFIPFLPAVTDTLGTASNGSCACPRRSASRATRSTRTCTAARWPRVRKPKTR